MNKKVALIVCDGFGYSKKKEGNAVELAKMPFYSKLLEKYPHSFLRASGKFVGLKPGQMGNSETGHMNIGAGKIVSQDLTRIDNAIMSKELEKNTNLLEFFGKIKKQNGDVHFLGLVSNGGVHSHIEHLKALVVLAKKFGIKNSFVHMITDGRDVDIHSAIMFNKELEKLFRSIGYGEIASVQGRFYAMDRDKHYDYICKAYDAIINSNAEKIDNVSKYLKQCYQNDITDEFIIPAVVCKNNNPVCKFDNEKDGILFFNFRKDRTKELSEAFCLKDFDKFDVKFKIKNYLTMTNYGDFDCKVMFEKELIPNTLVEVLTNNNLSVGKFAEPTKYAHVTYFLNGGREQPFENEKWFLVPAKKVRTFDEAPEMSAIEIANEIVVRCKENNFDFVMANLANCDMVGHTGNLKATIKAVETVDSALKIIVENLKRLDYEILITADHGNAEQMIFRNKVCTTHTNNPVRLVYVSNNLEAKVQNGSLRDLAPTVLSIFGIDLPNDYTGKNLIKNKKLKN